MTQVMRRMQDMTDNDTNEWTMSKKKDKSDKKGDNWQPDKHPRDATVLNGWTGQQWQRNLDTKKSQDPTPGSRNIKTLLLNLPKVNA